MPKILCIAGLVIAVLIIIAMCVDLAIAQASILMDISFIICGIVLGVISYLTLKEQA